MKKLLLFSLLFTFYSISYSQCTPPTLNAATLISSNGSITQADGVITLTGTGLTNGKFDIIYRISSPALTSNYYATCGYIPFTGGNGDFIINRNVFPTPGNYTITILGISESFTACYNNSISSLTTTINVL